MESAPTASAELVAAKRWRREKIELLDSQIVVHAETAARVAGWRSVREVLDNAGDAEVVELYEASRRTP